MNEKPVIILGNGGHAKVLTDILLLTNREVIGYTSLTDDYNQFSLPYLGEDDAVLEYKPEEIELVNAIGSTTNTTIRRELFDFFKDKGYRFSNVIHPDATVSKYVKLGEGIQIIAGAVIQSFVEIADNTIVNTSVSIDHDCKIGKHCHIAPGATLCGMVTIGENTHIGAGSTIIQGVKIGSNALIGAGALVLKDINNDSKAYGVPAKEV